MWFPWLFGTALMFLLLFAILRLYEIRDERYEREDENEY